jgi:hypothetical protein
MDIGSHTLPAGWPSPSNALSIHPPSATRKSISSSGSVGPPAPDWNTPSPRIGASGSNISTASSDGPTFAFPRARNTIRRSDFHSLRIGLNRKVDWPGSSNWTPKTDLTDPESDRWEIHGQTTYLPQGYPAFRALYTGPNSLTPAPQAQATWSNSLFLNARLWEGGDVYYNPELLQGFGLNDTVGAGGPTAGAESTTPRITIHRGYICGRPLASAASRNLPAGRPNLAARWMFPA